MNEEERKRELRAFLMSRRARLTPADVGLTARPRRRTPGLRREDVAELAEISTAWYTAFEMAKDNRVSMKMIESVARALRLNTVELRHLHVLSGAQKLPTALFGEEGHDETLEPLLAGYRDPAVLFNRRLDVVAMNYPASELFGQLDQARGFERNALWHLFRNKSTRTMKNGWEGTARCFTGAFRAAYCEHQGDPGFDSLLDELLRNSAEFQSWWRAHNVGSIEEPRPIVMERPRFGHLAFIGRGLPASMRGGVYCFFFLPERETARSDGYARLLAASSRGRELTA